MRNTAITILFILSAITVAMGFSNHGVVLYPTALWMDAKNISLDSLNIGDSAARVSLTVSDQKGKFLIPPSVFLRSGAKEYRLLGADGFADGDSILLTPVEGRASVTLLFEPLPEDATEFDFYNNKKRRLFAGIDLIGDRDINTVGGEKAEYQPRGTYLIDTTASTPAHIVVDIDYPDSTLFAINGIHDHYVHDPAKAFTAMVVNGRMDIKIDVEGSYPRLYRIDGPLPLQWGYTAFQAMAYNGIEERIEARKDSAGYTFSFSGAPWSETKNDMARNDFGYGAGRSKLYDVAMKHPNSYAHIYA